MSKPIHTYLDLDVVNNNLNSSAAAPQLRFEEKRNSSFLEGDTSDYFCSIVRFSIQTGNSLPIFIPRIETGQGDINKTVYKVTQGIITNLMSACCLPRQMRRGCCLNRQQHNRT